MPLWVKKKEQKEEHCYSPANFVITRVMLELQRQVGLVHAPKRKTKYHPAHWLHEQID